MEKRKLRIGLLLDGTELAAWAYRMIEIISQSDYAEISLIVQNSLPAEERRLTLASKIASKIRERRFWTTVIRLALATLVRLLIGKPGRLPDASKQVDGTELLAGVEVIKVYPRRQQFSDYIEGDDLARIHSVGLSNSARRYFGQCALWCLVLSPWRQSGQPRRPS